jgi:hypothetical protein
MIHMQIGWLSAAMCAIISAQCARIFFVRSPRLFSALALMALAWAMLLPFYGGVVESPLLPGFGSFLLVYVSGLVRSEVRLRDKTTDAPIVDVVSQLALLSLIPLAIPSVPLQAAGKLGLRAEYFQLAAATILGAVGYLALWLAVRSLLTGVTYYVMTAITFAYMTLEITYLIGQFPTIAQSNQLMMTAPLAYGFGVAKLVFTVVFAYALIHYDQPHHSVSYVVWRFFGVHRQQAEPEVQSL